MKIAKQQICYYILPLQHLVLGNNSQLIGLSDYPLQSVPVHDEKSIKNNNTYPFELSKVGVDLKLILATISQSKVTQIGRLTLSRAVR